MCASPGESCRMWSKLDVVDLGDGADVPGHRFGDFDLRLALQHVEVSGLDRLPAFADVELRSRRDSSLVDAKHRQPADVGVDLDLEDVRERMQARIGQRGDVGRRAASGGNVDVHGRIALGRIGQQLDDHIQQLADAGAGPGRGEHDRDQVAFAHRALERLVQRLGRDVALLEVGLHQLLVHLDHLLDQFLVRFFDRGEIGFAGGREEAVRHLARAGRRQVQRQALLAEGLLDFLQQRRQVHVVGVDAVDDHQAVEAALRRPLHEAAGHHLDAVLGVDHDRRGLDRGERRQRMAEEVRIARRVEQVDPVLLVLEARDRELERMLEALLERRVVADGGAALHAAGRRDRACARQQRLGQRGLARAGLADQREGADTLDGVLGHGALLR